MRYFINRNTLIMKEQLVDTTKWKSIAVSIDVYNMLRKEAEKNDRSVSKQLAHIVKKNVAEKAA